MGSPDSGRRGGWAVFGAYLYAEFLKIRRSRAFPGTLAALGIAPLMDALFVVVLGSADLAAGNDALRAKAAASGFSPDWPGYLGMLVQAVAVGGVVVFGFVAAWIFGREYSDRVAKDLFTLPAPRSYIVLSKMIAMVAWCLVLVLFVFVLGLLIGLFLDMPGFSGATLARGATRLFTAAALVIPLGTPVALMASVGRGYLLAFAFVIFALVFAQVIGALGFGAYFPWAVPALYAEVTRVGVRPGVFSYSLPFVMGVIGLVATLVWWKYADQT